MRSWRARSTSSSTRNPRGGTSSTETVNAPRVSPFAIRDFSGRGTGATSGDTVTRAAPPRARVFPGLRSDLTYRALDVTDVFRRGPATTADEPDAAADEPLRVRSHVLGRAQINVSSFDLARPAGVRLRGQLHGRHLRHPLDRFEHRRRPDAAIQPNDLRAEVLERRHERFRRRPVEAVAIFFSRHLRDDRQVADAAHRTDRRADL